MMTETEIIKYVAGGLGLSGGAGWGLVVFIRWLKATGAVNAQSDANTTMYDTLRKEIGALHNEITSLRDERLAQEKTLEETKSERDDLHKMISELRSQNKLLKLLLIQKGMSNEELMALEVWT